MRIPLLPILAVLILGAAVDLYIYRAIKRNVANVSRRKMWCRIQAISSTAMSIALIAIILLPKRGGEDEALRAIMWALYAYLSIYFPKILYTAVDATGKLLACIRHRCTTRISSAIGATAAVALFAAMWWGALINRFDTQVKHVDVEIARLPAGFENFTIAQISDLHVGTYGTDTTFMADVVQQINDLKPDMIVFTGDIVNRHSDELKPFITTLSRLSAPYGVYSITGNHDYGDYMNWPSDSAKLRNLTDLHAMQASMGWHMLNNDHEIIRSDGDSIVLVGVENVGDPPFRTYGDLSVACPDSLYRGKVKILLSHNPTHWTDSIADNPASDIALTLSGHTHAMQCEVFGLSPASMRYHTWGGLYSDTVGQQLYVNIGIGSVGVPARIGATPEITLLTLRRRSDSDTQGSRQQ